MLEEGQVKREAKMITAIFILIALAALHFVYESILAPSFRLSIRFKLFALSDLACWMIAISPARALASPT